jgi:hypothetical protein
MRGRRLLLMLVGAALALNASAGGCVSGRTVFVADDSPLRIGPGTTGTVYRLLDDAWVLSPDRVVYPEGWYIVPPRFVEPGDFAR